MAEEERPVDVLQRLRDKRRDTVCLPCFALEGTLATVEAHASLRLIASVATASGTREEFVCGTCGQRMARFLAKQISPPPADAWRFQREGAIVEPPSNESVVPQLQTMPPIPDVSSDMGMESDYLGL